MNREQAKEHVSKNFPKWSVVADSARSISFCRKDRINRHDIDVSVEFDIEMDGQLAGSEIVNDGTPYITDPFAADELGRVLHEACKLRNTLE